LGKSESFGSHLSLGQLRKSPFIDYALHHRHRAAVRLHYRLAELATVPEKQINEKKKRELKAEREMLFRQLLENPQEIHLALEIKAIDDKIDEMRTGK
jgi:hypothetical protein